MTARCYETAVSIAQEETRLRRLVPRNRRRQRELHVTALPQKIEPRGNAIGIAPFTFKGVFSSCHPGVPTTVWLRDIPVATGNVILATGQSPEGTSSTVPWSDLIRFESSS